MTLLESILALLKKRHFLSVATADKKCEPHTVPKFFLKTEGNYFYFVDYAIAKTVENIKANPRVATSFMDLENLEGYRVSGDAQLIQKGPAFEKLLKELDKKLLQLSVDRVIEGMRTGKRHQHFELELPNKVIFIKMKVSQVARVGSQGEFFRENH